MSRCADCGRSLGRRNRSGLCLKHWRIRQNRTPEARAAASRSASASNVRRRGTLHRIGVYSDERELYRSLRFKTKLPAAEAKAVLARHRSARL